MKYERKDPEDGGGLVRRRFFDRACGGRRSHRSVRERILMDAEAARVLYELDADTRSLVDTRKMHGLLACETLALDAEYAVPAEAVGIEGSSMYDSRGERVTGRELLYGLMLRWATTRAILCDGSGGSALPRGWKHRRQSSEWKIRIFRIQTAWTGISPQRGIWQGWPADENPDFREAAGTKNASFARRLTNHNKLLWSYPGANGVKTGAIRAAGRILVSSAERGGHDLRPGRWNDHTAAGLWFFRI